MVGATRSTIREKRPAHPMRRAFRDAASVRIHASPPGSYWYHIGTVTGPRSGPADTDRAAMCGSARNSSRSRTDSLLSTMNPSLGSGTDNRGSGIVIAEAGDGSFRFIGAEPPLYQWQPGPFDRPILIFLLIAPGSRGPPRPGPC